MKTTLTGEYLYQQQDKFDIHTLGSHDEEKLSQLLEHLLENGTVVDGTMATSPSHQQVNSKTTLTKILYLTFLTPLVRGDFNIHGTKNFQDAVFLQKSNIYDVVSFLNLWWTKKTCSLHEILTQLVITENI